MVLVALALLLALAAAGAADSRPVGFPYSRLAAVWFAVYAATGAVAARRAGFGAGLLAAFLVGLLDAILNPVVAWMVGSGPVEAVYSQPRLYAYRVVVVTATALGVGLLSAWAGAGLRHRQDASGRA